MKFQPTYEMSMFFEELTEHPWIQVVLVLLILICFFAATKRR